MFERSLSSLIKGLRSHRGRDERKYVATLMEEIKHEIRSGDMDVKAEAVLKLTYLQMLGYPPSNASFHMLEVMASPRFHLKELGYLAASQCFNEDTDVLILATNLLKKDLRSSIPLEVAVALNGLSHIVTSDLAQHLTPDVITLLTHSRPAIRKKALLVLYSIIVHYPPALEQSLPRLREKLEDDDVGVVSATINIICELSRNNATNAKTFLTLSPQFFHLLTSSTNNWMIIKIIKLFGVLTPLEPRLVKKLIPPISEIISTTPAMSLLYECIHTIIIGKMLNGPEGDDLASTCVEKLAAFLDDDDQNLKYIALLALVKIIPTHPHLVALHQEEIFDSMEDDDLSIRMRALDLVSGMAGRSNYRAIVEHQLKHIESGHAIQRTTAAASLKLALQGSQISHSISAPCLSASYQKEIIDRILDLGSNETYGNVIDFEWYIDVLIRLAYRANDSTGYRIQQQLIDITSRVRAVRPHAISKLKQVLEDEYPLEGSQKEKFHLIRAAAWICGEYCQDVPFPPAIISLLLRKEILDACKSKTVSMLLHNAVKLFSWWLLEVSKDWKEDRLIQVKVMTNEVSEALRYVLKTTQDAEVEERAIEYCQLLLLLGKDLQGYAPSDTVENSTVPAEETTWNRQGTINSNAGPKSLLLLSPLFFGYTLGPVAKKAQGKVVVPIELDLEQCIVNPEEVEICDPWEEEKAAQSLKEKSKKNGKGALVKKGEKIEISQAEAKERARMKADRLKRQQESPFYIGSKAKYAIQEPEVDVDEIPIVQLQLDDVLYPVSAGIKEPASSDIRNNASATSTATAKEEEEMPEEELPPSQVIRKVVGNKNKKKKKTKAVEESSLT